MSSTSIQNYQSPKSPKTISPPPLVLAHADSQQPTLQGVISPRGPFSPRSGKCFPISPNRRKPHKPLQLQDCGGAGKAVRDCLSRVTGLTVTENTIDATRKLGKDDNLDPVVEAIGFLVDAGALNAAYTVIRMCKPEFRRDLLDKCSRDHAEQLKTSVAEGAPEARNHAFSIAAHDAWHRQDLTQFFKLLPLCSHETRLALREKFPQLTPTMVQGLDDDALIALVHTERERIQAQGAATRLTELHSLLSIAAELEGRAPAGAVTMKCIVWAALIVNQASRGIDEFAALHSLAWFPALTPELLDLVPDGLRSEVLRVAVDQAVQAEPFQTVKRLSELASLFNEIKDPELATGLRSRIMQALIGLPEQWNPTAFKHHAQSIQAILKNFIGKLDKLWDVDGFAELGLKLLDHSLTTKQTSDALLLMVTLVAKLPTIEQAVSHLQRLHSWLSLRMDAGLVEELQLRIKWALNELPAEVDIQAILMAVWQTGRSAQDVQHALLAGNIEKASRLVADSQDTTFHVVATARLIEYSTNRPAVVSIRVEEQRRTQQAEEAVNGQLAMVRMVLEKLEFVGDDLRRQMRDALPTLCNGANGFELDFILATEQGQKLAAQAVIDYLSMSHLSGAELVSLFAALAHRVDLRSAIPATEHGTWGLLEQQMNVELDEVKLAGSMDQWSPGWRLLFSIKRNSEKTNSESFGEVDTRRREAAVAIDAAAAGARLESVRVLAERLDGWTQEALAMMLNFSVAGQPLLSDGALRNVVDVVLSDKDLTRSMFAWIKERPRDQQVRLYTALVRALVSPPHDRPLSGVDGQLPANDFAAYVTSILIDQPELAEAVQSQLDKDHWARLWFLATMKK